MTAHISQSEDEYYPEVLNWDFFSKVNSERKSHFRRV